mgnify:CR=1 FL=1|tara:strand:- start:1599 stop:2081 length:483 start_codon:yes stop_codon:yes gene_type:complete
MKKIALYPGSFDPITLGHVDIVLESVKLFDKVVIGIGNNNSKNQLFNKRERIKFINSIFSKNKNIITESYDGLTIDFCKKINASFIVRGMRDINDFEYEKKISTINKKIKDDITTLFFFPKIEHSIISSSMVKEIIKNGGDLNMFLPLEVVKLIHQIYKT